MKFIEFYKSLFSFAVFSFALPNNVSPMELDTSELDKRVDSHDVSDWKSGVQNAEMTSAVVNGLISTSMKADLIVQPRTSVLDFKFYKYITQVKKTLLGVASVRLANIIIHYQPYSDECRGTISFALVDTRFADVMDVESHSINEKKNNHAKIVGKVKHLVTVDCSKEAFIQFSMNHKIAVSDINKIKMCQIVSGIDMVKGKLAALNIGWLTVQGDSTIFTPFPAQLYYFPRKSLPELQGKSASYTYDKFVKMAKRRYDTEVAMLNKLQKLVDEQNIITNHLESDIVDEISEADTKIKKLQQEIEMVNNVIPNKQKLNEMKSQIDELERIKKDKITEMMKERSDLIEDLNKDDDNEFKVEINDNKSVDFSNIVMN